MDLFDLREPVSAWSHGAGLLLALAGTLLLWRRSRGCRPAKRLSLLVFGLSLAACYAASTLYHALRIPDGQLDTFDRLDRIGIFLLIAGTYTPLVGGLLRGRWRWATLATIWSITAVASVRLAIGGPFPPLLTTGLYLGMGWGGFVCYTELARAVSRRALRPLIAGGVSYSVGAVLNLLRWPVLWPGLVGGHELFHLFVLGGSLTHYVLVLQVVVPFEPTPDLRPAGPSGAVESEDSSLSQPSPVCTPAVS